MTARVYATVTDYRANTPDQFTTDARVNYLLGRASRSVDRAMIGAVYPTDPQGYPADASLIDVMMRATCEQAYFMVDQDDDSGVKQRLDQVTVGGLSFHRAAGTSGLALPPLCPAALEILQLSGVGPTAPMSTW